MKILEKKLRRCFYIISTASILITLLLQLSLINVGIDAGVIASGGFLFFIAGVFVPMKLLLYGVKMGWVK